MTAAPSCALDLMAAACQRHCKAVERAHASEKSAMRRATLARERELLQRIDVLRRSLDSAGQDDPARAALVDLLAGVHGFHVNSRVGAVVVATDSIPTTFALAASPATQQVVLQLMPTIDAERAHRRKLEGVPA